MYRMIENHALPIGGAGKWTSINGEMTIKSMFANYRHVYISLKNEYEDVIWIDTKDLYPLYHSYSFSIDNLIAAIPFSHWKPIQKPILPKVNSVRYIPIQHTRLKANLGKLGMNVPDGYPRADLVDIEITSSRETALNEINNQALVTVNGIVHWTEMFSDRLFVKKGAMPLNKGNSNTVGILSFADIGKITKIPLTTTIVKPDDGFPMAHRCTVNLSSQDTTGKTVFLVLGGYLVFIGEALSVGTGGLMTLSLSKLPFVERLMESYKLFDSAYSPEMELSPTDDEFVIKYLTQHNSFAVVVDAPTLVVNTTPVRNASLPGTFIALTKPEYPLAVGYGVLADYWATEEEPYYAVSVTSGVFKNYAFTSVMASEANYQDTALPNSAFLKLNGRFLEIASF